MIHRDIEPGNVMIARGNLVKALDFGLARILEHSETITRSGTCVGTPAYMSPEQALGRGPLLHHTSLSTAMIRASL